MEVCLMQPMVAFKNALQEGRPLPRTPTQMYRGLLVGLLCRPYPALQQLPWDLANIAPATAPRAFPINKWLHLLQINCGSIAPITASQFGTNRFMERLLMQRSGQSELGTWGRFGCAAVAGTVSALVASPTELIIIQQQVRAAWGHSIEWGVVTSA